MNNLKDIHNRQLLFRIVAGLFNQDFNEQFAAKVQKIRKIYKFIRKYLDILEKSTTFVPTNLKDIHNKDYSVV